MALWFHTDQPRRRAKPGSTYGDAENAPSVPQRSISRAELWIGVVILAGALLIGFAFPWV